MRVLNLITRSEHRGAEVFAGQLADGLARRGHAVCLASLYRHAGPAAVLARDPEILREELDGRAKGGFERETFGNWRRLLRRFQPDIVVAHAFHALKYAALARKLRWTRAPLVYRNVSVASSWSGIVRREWGTWLARSVERVVSVSEASAADFSRHYRFPRARTQVIRRGVEIPRALDAEGWRERLRALVGAPLEGPVLMHLGGMTTEKDHRALLAIFEQVARAQPKARLVCFGDGPLRPWIDRWKAAAAAADRIHLVGNRAEAREYLSAADLLLLTSRIEGLPGVVLEAAARATPAVATDVGAVGEAVVDGQTGRLLPLDQPEAFAAAVLELLADPTRRLALGAAARARVRELHAMEDRLDQFESLLVRMVGDRAAPPSPPARGSVFTVRERVSP